MRRWLDAISRKAPALAVRPVLRVQAALADDTHYAADPPVLVNAVPKSGTHLVHGLLAELPRKRDWGQFIASVPSIRFHERPPSALLADIARIVPGERLRAHLHFDEALATQLAARRVCQFLIVRDPRDVLVSEVHYILHSAPWHGLHRYITALPDMHSRMRFAISGQFNGQPVPHYPAIDVRYRHYSGWAAQPGVCLLRYEELVGDGRTAAIERIAKHLVASHPAGFWDGLDLVNLLINATPKRAHTFREGRSGGWRAALSAENQQLFEQVAGDLLIELGYESGANG